MHRPFTGDDDRVTLLAEDDVEAAHAIAQEVAEREFGPRAWVTELSYNGTDDYPDGRACHWYWLAYRRGDQEERHYHLDVWQPPMH